VKPTKGPTIDLQGSLERAILACDDEGALIDLLDDQAFVSPPSERLDGFLRRHIVHPLPFLTAKVFRVYRHTGSQDLAVHEAAASYLNIAAYDGEWYDETINSIGWANELLAAGSASPLVDRYRQFLDQVEEQDHQELREFCRGYER
jgi:hypothetical protein